MFGRFERWFGNGALGIVDLLMTVFCVFLSLSIHEFAHGYAAHKMGDDTAKNMGRLNLSPLSHIDPIGAVCLFLFGFGWAKPVPVNYRNFGHKRYKLKMVVTSIAGPLSNLLLAFIGCVVFHVFAVIEVNTQLAFVLLSITRTLAIMNVSLAVFNLIPIPPLDGSKILNAVLPARIYFRIMQYEQYGFIVLILLLNFSPLRNFMSLIVQYIIYGYEWVIMLLPFF